MYQSNKLQVKSVFLAVFDRGFSSVAHSEVLGDMNRMALMVAPIITLLTVVILTFTLLKMIDQFFVARFNYSPLRLKKMKEDKPEKK